MQPSTVMPIGPTEATRLLEGNKNNRPISDKIVQQYAAEMRAGGWRETGNPINIDVDGSLLNGQHRLWAIIESGVTLRFHVIYESDPEAFATFDTGRMRTADTLIGMVRPEHTDKACAAGATRLVYLARHTEPDQSFNKNILPTRSGLVAYAEDLLNDKKFWWASSVAKQIQPLRAGRTWYAAALFLIAEAQDDEYGYVKVMEFHDGVATGAGLTAQDPRLTLRNYMIKNGGPSGLVEQRLYMAAVVRVFNAWSSGKPLSRIQLGQYEVLPAARVVAQ